MYPYSYLPNYNKLSYNWDMTAPGTTHVLLIIMNVVSHFRIDDTLGPVIYINLRYIVQTYRLSD